MRGNLGKSYRRLQFPKSFLISFFFSISFLHMPSNWLFFKVIPQYCIAHLYCARFSRHYSRANEHMHVHNERHFPQAKFDSKINVNFLSNGHGDLYFLFCSNNVNIILFDFEKLKKGRKN